MYGLDADEYREMTRTTHYDRMLEGIVKLFALAGPDKVTLAIRHLKLRTPRAVSDWLDDIARRAGIQRSRIRYSWTLGYANWAFFDTSKPLPYDAKWTPNPENTCQCSMPLVSAQVLSDGTVSFCGCMDFDANSSLVIGNIATSSLKELFAGERVWKLMNWAEYGVPDFCKGCSAHKPIETLLQLPSVFERPLETFGS